MATPNIVPRADQEGGLGTAAKSWGKLFIENAAAGGTAAVTVSNLDVDKVALDINASNTTANVVDIVTDSLTSGKAIHLDINDPNTGVAINDVILIDHDKTGVTGSGSSNYTVGLNVNLRDNATNHSLAHVISRGINVDVNSSTNAAGTNQAEGLRLNVSGSDVATTTGIDMMVTNGANDIVMKSSADTGDFCSIAVGADGATTLTTVDDDGAGADLDLNADGDITLDATGDIILSPASGSTIQLDGAVIIDAGVVTGATSITSTAFIVGGHSVADIDLAGEFTDASDHILSSAAALDKFHILNANTTGSAATLTTPRAIFGQNFDGSAAVTGNATLGGIVMDGNTITGVDDSGEFTDDDAHLMTSAAINDKFAVINADTTGSSGSCTGLAATATALATTRAIGGVNFNGTAAINLPGVNIAGNQNTSGTAATVTGAAQTAITSVGTLTALQVDNININGNAITSSTAADMVINVTDGQSVVIEGLDIDDGVVTGASSITSTTFVGNTTFAPTGGTDGAFRGDVVYFGGTTSMTIGTIYNYKSDGTWEAADADAVATSDGLLAVALGAASDTNGMLLRGMVTLDHDPGAIGDVLFLSTTAGDASATAPSGSGDIVRVIGYQVNHASQGEIWFNPDSTYVEIA